MIPYWLIFLVPAFAAARAPTRRNSRLINSFGLLIAVFLGGRFEVGADWVTYAFHFERIASMRLQEVLSLGDPGYYLVNWLAFKSGLGIVGVNIVCGGLFAWGLIAFAKLQPSPWLALAVAVPYLVIVVAMGYSRQGVAIGLVLLGLAKLQRGAYMHFAVAILIATSFHKTAILMLPIVALSLGRGRIWTALWSIALAVLAYFVFLESSVDTLVDRYIYGSYQSEGVYIRVAMNVVPAIVYLLYRRMYQGPMQTFWTLMALGSVFLIPLLLVVPSTTIIDRVALYFIPIQIYVLSSASFVVVKWRGYSKLVTAMVLMYSFSVQFVWLNFASNVGAWLPYKFFLLV